MKKGIQLFLFLIISFSAFTQKRDCQWYFEYNKGLDFNSGAPVQIATGKQYAIEASSAIADSVTGALLFYMDNDTLYDNTNVQFPNGKGMKCAATPTQHLTLPMPGNKDKYYVIMHTDPNNWGPPSGVSYSVVDMTLNGGKGDVVAAQKNILAVNPGGMQLSEGMTAIKHANGYDWWVLSHGLIPAQNGTTYYKFLITSAGVLPMTTQNIGTNATNNTGYLVASPDGKRVCRVDIQGHINVFDFDRCTGVLSNLVDLSEPFNQAAGTGSFYGCAFSPDNKVLYVTCNYKKELFQYDLTAANIALSKQVVFTPPPGGFLIGLGGLQLAPDGKIYFVNTNTKLCAINNPNVLGVGCNPGTVNSFTWPMVNWLIYFPNYNLGGTSTTASAGNDVTICSGSNTQLNVTSGNSYLWSPSAGLSCVTCQNPVATPVATTTYVVSVSGSCGTSTDTVKVAVVNSSSANAGNDVTICSGSSATLNASGGGTYSWISSGGLSNTSISNPTASPSSTSTYSVIVQLGSCPADTDDVTVVVTQAAVANAGSDATICSGSVATLSASGGVNYVWTPSIGISNSSISNPSASPSVTTTYSVIVQLGNCAADTDAVTITVNPSAVANAGSDKTICPGTTVSLNASGGGTYAWIPTTGLSNPSISNPTSTPAVSTTYSVIVQLGNCPADTDTVSVFINVPASSAGSDVTIAYGASTVLNASGGVTYLWSPASSLVNPTSANPTASPTSTTTYCVIVTDAIGCSDTSSCVTVYVLPEPLPCGTFYLPNAFSPNQDLENDEFMAYIRPECIKEFKLTIFNRWGVKVFQTDDVTVGWNGEYNGEAANAGVYAFFCRGVLADGKDFKIEGNVSLVR